MKNNCFILFLLLFIWSCNDENRDDCFTSTGKNTKESRLLEEFNKLEIHDRMTISFTPSSNHEVKITAGKNLLESINTDVSDRTLILENNNTCNWVRKLDREIKVDIFAPDLSEITFYAHGSFNFTNQLNTDTLLVNMWESSGDLNLKVTANYLELKSHTGTGTITCEGEAAELVAFIGGNGFVEAKNCPANKVLAVNENTGKLSVHSRVSLNASITNRGDIFYKGNPSINLNNTGSGELINHN